MNKKIFKLSLGSLLAVSTLSSAAHAEQIQLTTQIARPPQFVLIGFDGGRDVNQWKATRAFADKLTAEGKPLRLTYFISGAYLLRDANKSIYQPPKRNTGYSAIGFGGNSSQIEERLQQINAAFSEGHEIANRGNGHFNGKNENWSQGDWESELKQFTDLLFGAYFNNNLTPDRKYTQGFALKEKDIMGFRAPQLGINASLYPALKNQGLSYDVSSVGTDTAWPAKDNHQIWRISVPMLELGESRKKITGLDYNFYYIQSAAKADLENKDQYKNEMLSSYRNYFAKNYYGGRGPIKIGHHFENFNGGAYWEALQDFATEICGQPEVQCVTYKTYVEWLESLTPEIFAAYRTGNFEKMSSTVE